MFMMVSSISAVVGGIVIMNVMLVSVTERTKEIGVRRALGATKRDIAKQFLTESVMQCLIGGFVGVSAGFIIALLLRTFTAFPASVQTWVAILGLVLSSIIGLFFGIYPAMRASESRSGRRAASGLDMTRAEATGKPAGRDGHAAIAQGAFRADHSGIVIGVTSVISVASIIDGLNAYIQNKVESFGARTYFVSRIPLGPRFGRLPEKIRPRKYFQHYGRGIRSRRCVHRSNSSPPSVRGLLLWAKQRYPLRRKCGRANHPARRGT